MRQRLDLLLLAVCATNSVAQSQELATCRNPTGRAFYHFDALLDKAHSGWTDDKISNSVFTLTKAADGTLDLLYVDTRKKPISATQDGGIVRLLRQTPTNVTILLYYPDGGTTEIYSFFKEKDGMLRFTMLQNKTGDAAPIPKSALLVGTCDSIRF